MTDDTDTLDHKAGRLWTKALAVIPFGIFLSLVASTYRNRAAFETLGDYVFTALFAGFWLLIALWLWRSKRPLSDVWND